MFLVYLLDVIQKRHDILKRIVLDNLIQVQKILQDVPKSAKTKLLKNPKVLKSKKCCVVLENLHVSSSGNSFKINPVKLPEMTWTMEETVLKLLDQSGPAQAQVQDSFEAKEATIDIKEEFEVDIKEEIIDMDHPINDPLDFEMIDEVAMQHQDQESVHDPFYDQSPEDPDEDPLQVAFENPDKSPVLTWLAHDHPYKLPPQPSYIEHDHPYMFVGNKVEIDHLTGKPIKLWQFLLEMLANKSYEALISWTGNHTMGSEFVISQPEEVKCD